MTYLFNRFFTVTTRILVRNDIFYTRSMCHIWCNHITAPSLCLILSCSSPFMLNTIWLMSWGTGIKPPVSCLLSIPSMYVCVCLSLVLGLAQCHVQTSLLTHCCHYFCLPLLCLCFFLVVGLPFAILTMQHAPYKRGFFCNDDSIKYPLKDDTISYQLLGGVMIPLTLLTVSVLFVHVVSASSSLSLSSLPQCFMAPVL